MAGLDIRKAEALGYALGAAQLEALDMAQACDDGQCKYAEPKPPYPACVGHRGNWHPNGLVRYQMCPRHVAWWGPEKKRREQEKKRRRKALPADVQRAIKVFNE